VFQVHTEEELKELQEVFPETQNFIALEFDSEA
jgi:CHASE2 domain-containing sensor protein